MVGLFVRLHPDLLQPDCLDLTGELLREGGEGRVEGLAGVGVFGDPVLEGVPAPDEDVDRPARLVLLQGQRPGQRMKGGVVRGRRDDEIFPERRLEGQGLGHLMADLGFGQDLVGALQLALDADALERIAVPASIEIDTALLLAAASILVDVGILQQAAPQHRAGPFEGLLVEGFGNLAGGGEGHVELGQGRTFSHMRIRAVASHGSAIVRMLLFRRIGRRQ